MNQALGVGSIAGPVDQQSRALLLYHGCPHTTIVVDVYEQGENLGVSVLWPITVATVKMDSTIQCQPAVYVYVLHGRIKYDYNTDPIERLSICLSFCYLSYCLSICLPVYLTSCLSTSMPVYLTACLSIYLTACLSTCLSDCLSVYQLTY